MEIFEGLAGMRALPGGLVLSIGNFDGVHRGHGEILRVAGEMREKHRARGVAVVTFEPHPFTALRPGEVPPRLTPVALKRELLQEAGVGYLVELAPTPGVLEMTAGEFWGVIRDEVRPVGMVEGESFLFGKGRAGTVEHLRSWAGESGIGFEVVESVEAVLCDYTMVRVSSSLIRWLVWHGRMRDAERCLGRPFRLGGQVIKGHQRGREIGVPTANLDCGDQLVPGDGVYAGRAVVEGKNWPAAISVGTMATFGGGRRQVEVHLIGFSGDLYGEELRVEVKDWVRDQRKFQNVDALKVQLRKDIQTAAKRDGGDLSVAIG